MQNKIRGMFLGIAIGDALGMPVETFSAAQIKARYGRVTKYLRPTGHKWFSDRLEGTWTDDTQLSLAIARSLINRKKLDLDDQANEHIKELKRGAIGWGGSTRNAVIKLAAGTHWSQSGKSDKSGHGTGNGVVMKTAPIGAYLTLKSVGQQLVINRQEMRAIRDLVFMTHATNMAVVSAFAQIAAVNYCLTHSAYNFSSEEFLSWIFNAVELVNAPEVDIKRGLTDDLREKLIELLDLDYGRLSDSKIIKLFGSGQCYVLHSLPFSYAFFIRNPRNICSLYDVINSGGDTDSNGSIVGALLGALHGSDLFNRRLIGGLWRNEEILKTADNFYKTFKNAAR